MARAPRDNSEAKSAASGKVECGVIMPISATASHSEEHWAEVQTLLHRGIDQAGFSPRNVWESSTNDRISERIIGNIFRFPLAVADVSDLNPNVMFELGLRLSSKKPTIVVMNAGGSIPFDIRDFHALFYPPDMNMLGMEDFFARLEKALRDKHAASENENYTPFLNSVIVDVASPETRELGANELLLSRLDDLSERLSRIETPPRPLRPRSSSPPREPLTRGAFDFTIPEDSFDAFETAISSWYEIDEINKTSTDNGVIKGVVEFSGYQSIATLRSRIETVISKLNGSII